MIIVLYTHIIVQITFRFENAKPILITSWKYTSELGPDPYIVHRAKLTANHTNGKNQVPQPFHEVQWDTKN